MRRPWRVETRRGGFVSETDACSTLHGCRKPRTSCCRRQRIPLSIIHLDHRDLSLLWCHRRSPSPSANKLAWARVWQDGSQGGP